LAGTTPNKVEVISLNLPPPSCVDMSKKKKKKDLVGVTWYPLVESQSLTLVSIDFVWAFFVLVGSLILIV
jgi:hypothetical protein